MPESEPIAGRALIRRTYDGGRLREFLHPADGSRPVERLPVLHAADVAAPPPTDAAVEGQLIGRPVTAEDLARPLLLPLLRASCEGTGACCAMYHHIPATPEDRDRITALLDGWRGEVPLDAAFHEAFPGEPGWLNVATVRGGCAFLGADGLCAVHARGGAEAKPVACRVYPASFVVSGERWVASLRPECACVPRTALEGATVDADPLSWAHLRTLLRTVWVVPDTVRWGQRSLPRPAYETWTHRTVGALKQSFDAADTVVAAIAAMDGELRDGGPAALPGGQPPAAWLAAVRDWLLREGDDAAVAWPPDAAFRRALRWGAEAVEALIVHGPKRDPGRRGREADWARRSALTTAFLIHGHDLLRRPALRGAAVELVRILWLARACRSVRPVESVDPRLEETTAWFFLQRTAGWPDGLDDL